MTKYMTLKDLSENLVNFLPEDQQKYKDSRAYKDLVMAFYRFLRSEGYQERAENRQAFAAIRENFDNFCLFERRRRVMLDDGSICHVAGSPCDYRGISDQPVDLNKKTGN